eukprot:3124761-Pleurochrysis_carterae.AAC.2
MESQSCWIPPLVRRQVRCGLIYDGGVVRVLDGRRGRAVTICSSACATWHLPISSTPSLRCAI